ncbi:MAG: ABC transporter ATP-binding protein [Desulfobacteraceae bacterium]|nr:ABC transporter ATP-binding protein [Desulfobacteraceae bacterium]
MVVLSIESCSKLFSGLLALSNVSLAINEGEIMGLIGPNGAGKTTLFNVIAGTYRPSEGRVLLGESVISGMAPEMICRKGVSRTFQVPKPFLELTVLQNVMIGTTLKNDYREAQRKAAEVLKGVGLYEKKEDYATNLTVPDLRKLEVAKALSTEPKLILLDEVMAGLRPNEVKDTLLLIKQINQQGVTFVVIEHNVEAVMSICDKICVLNYGEKIAEGTPEDIANDTEVISAYLGDDYAADHK